MIKEQKIDYRSPFYAVPNNAREKIILNTRVSGEKGLKSVDREEIINRFWTKLSKEYAKSKNPSIKDYIDWEKRFIPYAMSSRSRRVPGKLGVKDVEKYFTVPTENLSETQKRIFFEAINKVKANVRKRIPARSLRLLSPNSAAERMPGTTF